MEWESKREEMNRRVKAFTEEVCMLKSGCFGIKDFSGFEELHSFVGWYDVGTPAPAFIDTLRSFSETMKRRKKKGMYALAREAFAIAQELAPYTIFQEIMIGIRRDTGHKGFPRINNGMLLFSTPAASGGATMHNYNPADDFTEAMPSRNDLFIIAIQAGNLGGRMIHIGAGSRSGEHYFMLLPRSPFFSRVQAEVDDSQELNDLWKKTVCSSDDINEVTNASEWSGATADIKRQVLEDVVPQLIEERAIGWHIDMNTEKGTALMRPVVSEAHYEKEREKVEEYGLAIIRPNFEALLTKIGNEYGELNSVFSTPESVDKNPASMKA